MLKKMPKEYTAQMWRDGSNMRGETFHLWLEELHASSGLTLYVLNQLFDDAREHYMFEKGMIRDQLSDNDEIAISKRMEEALTKADEIYQKHRGAIPRHSFSSLKRLLRRLKSID